MRFTHKREIEVNPVRVFINIVKGALFIFALGLSMGIWIVYEQSASAKPLPPRPKEQPCSCGLPDHHSGECNILE